MLTQGRRPGKFLLKLLLRLLGGGQRLLERFDLAAKAIPLLDHRFKLQVGSNRRAPLATGHFCWRRRLLHRGFRKMHRQFTPPPERSLLDHTRVFVAAADERFDAPGQRLEIQRRIEDIAHTEPDRTDDLLQLKFLADQDDLGLGLALAQGLHRAEHVGFRIAVVGDDQIETLFPQSRIEVLLRVRCPPIERRFIGHERSHAAAL